MNFWIRPFLNETTPGNVSEACNVTAVSCSEHSLLFGTLCLLPLQWQSLVTNEKMQITRCDLQSHLGTKPHLLFRYSVRFELHVYTVAIFCTQCLAVQAEVSSFPSKFAFVPSAIEEKQLHHVVLSDLMLQNLMFSRPGFFCVVLFCCRS